MQALHHTLSKHSALSAVVELDHTPPQIAQVDQINLPDHITTIDLPTLTDGLEPCLQHVLDTLHRHKLRHDGHRPQWQLFVLPSTSNAESTTLLIAFACSHVLLDGISGFLFHQALLEGLNLAETGPQCDGLWTSPASLPAVPPAMDQAADFSISWPFLLRTILAEFLPTSFSRMLGLSSAKQLWHGADVRPRLPADHALIPTCIELWSLPAVEMTQLLSLCRKQECRLTGVLSNLLASALSDVLRGYDQQYNNFLVEVPYNLRRCIPGSATVMANYPSATEISVNTNATIGSETFWQQLRVIDGQIQRISQTLQDQPIALLQYVSDFDEWTLKRALNSSNASYSLSNLGIFQPGLGDGVPKSEKSKWQIHEMVFSQSGDATSTPLNVNVCSSKSGRFWMSTTWWPGMLGVEDEKVFIGQVLNNLTASIKSLLRQESQQ